MSGWRRLRPRRVPSDAETEEALRKLRQTWAPLAAASPNWQPDPQVKEEILRRILATPRCRGLTVWRLAWLLLWLAVRGGGRQPVRAHLSGPPGAIPDEIDREDWVVTRAETPDWPRARWLLLIAEPQPLRAVARPGEVAR